MSIFKFPSKENILIIVPEPNDKFNNYRDIIKLIQKENVIVSYYAEKNFTCN